MSKSTAFDVIVIGSGSAGFSAIEGALSLGAKVCVIEKETFGGECPNFACVPSKALLKSASVYRNLGDVRAYGLDASGRSFVWTRVMAYRKQVVEAITGGGTHGDRYKTILTKLNVDHRIGEAIFVDTHTIEVAGETLTAKAFVLATGTVDFVPPIPGLDQIPFWNWKKALQAKKQPKSLAIIGGGPVGCELATIFASFGTRVTLLQAPPVVLHREDAEISARALEALTDVGVNVIVGAQVTEGVNGRVGVMGLRVEAGGEETMHAVEQVLVATGKRPNTHGLNLDAAGVKLDERGGLETNAQGKTNQKHIFAAGDVDGGMQFTHTAHHEGWIAGYNAARVARKSRKKAMNRAEAVVPRVTFIDPEVASVGMTQAQVKEQHKKVLVGRYKVAALGRAVTDHDRRGLIKLVAEPKTKKLLGAHIISARAGEMIHECALAIHLGATMDQLASMIHAFPTYSEGIKAAAASAEIE